MLLDFWVTAQLGGRAGELVATDDDHLQRGDVGEAHGQVGQLVLMDEQRHELLQPVWPKKKIGKLD